MQQASGRAVWAAVTLVATGACAVAPAVSAAAPPLSFATVPRFVHCFNQSGPVNDDALRLWARPAVRLVTFGCCQAMLAPPVNRSEEAKIAAAGRQVKETPGSAAQTILYFPVGARSYYNVGNWSLQNPSTMLHNASGALLPGKLFDFGQPAVRAAVIDRLMPSVQSGGVDGFFLDGADRAGLARQSSTCDPATQARFLRGHEAFHRELRAALGPRGPIITLGDLYEGDSGELLGLLFLSSDGRAADVWQAIASVRAVRQAGGGANATVELIHDGTNRPLALAVFLLMADEHMLFHSPTRPLENFGLWSCDGWLDDPPEWGAPLGAPEGPYEASDGNTTLTRRFVTAGAGRTTVTVRVPASAGDRASACVRWADGSVFGACNSGRGAAPEAR